MRVVRALLYKEWREHGGVMLLLVLAGICLSWLYLASNVNSPNAVSGFQIVHTEVLTLLPLFAIVLGNRLIVREYQSGAWQFVEALPMKRLTQLLTKYLIGLVLMGLLVAVLVGMAGLLASPADDPSPDYLIGLWLKSAAMGLLFWGMAFCFSFSGHLRIALYGIVLVALLLVMQSSAIDASRFAPIALMDADLFVFERDDFPYAPALWTVALGVALSLAGFAVAAFAEGAVAERLSRPMNRRDLVVIGVLLFAGISLWTTLTEEETQGNFSFGELGVVRVSDPALSVLYLDEEHQLAAQRLAEDLQAMVRALQAELGIGTVPLMQIAHDASREQGDLDYFISRGLLVRANWFDASDYERNVLSTVVMHGLLSKQTGSRATQETQHWILDGFTRWWVEGGWQSERAQFYDQLMARAFWVSRNEASAAVRVGSEGSDQPLDPVMHLHKRFQQLAERHLYGGAEALAWSAMAYLEQRDGREAVLSLARAFLVDAHGNNVLTDLRDSDSRQADRFAAVVGQTREAFMRDWSLWLSGMAERDDAVRRLFERIPPVRAELKWPPAGWGEAADVFGGVQVRLLPDASLAVNAATDADALQEQLAMVSARCQLVHGALGPFDREYDDFSAERDDVECLEATNGGGSDVYMYPGLRLYLAFDMSVDGFAKPLRLGAWRVEVP